MPELRRIPGMPRERELLGAGRVIHGIELVHRTQYWAYVAGRHPPFLHLNEEPQVFLHLPRHTLMKEVADAWEWLDLVVVRDCNANYCAVLCGINGAEIAGSASGYVALRRAADVLLTHGQEGMRRNLIEWLDVRPLSPRWRFGREAEEESDASVNMH